MKSEFTDKFKSNHDDPASAFELLAMRMLAVQLGEASWSLNRSNTWPGVECDPIEIEGKYHSFQAKFYTNSTNGWNKLKESLTKVRDHVKADSFKLDICHVFVNWEKPVPKLNKNNQSKTQIDQCEEIAAEGGFTLSWDHFGSQILEQLSVDPNPEILKIARQFLTFPDQPQLDHPQNEGVSGIAKYHYAAKSRLNFVERTEVIDSLNQLKLHTEPFAWHTLVGSAGVGKSRSILEYCLQHLDETWKWGWLKYECKHDFSSWEPDANYLIVVDYAMGRIDQLLKILTACIDRAEYFHFKVRVLVAERMPEPWLQVLTSAPTVGTRILDAALQKDSNQISATPRVTEIRAFKKDGQLKLAQMALEKCPDLKLSEQELVDEVSKVDDEFRPLLVWLCAEHLARGEDLRYAEELLNQYIEHQRYKNWVPNGVSKQDENQTALITMCQGLSTAMASHWSPDAKQKVAKIDSNKHAIVLGSKQTSNELRPMEPDIVGELHGLNCAYGNNPIDTNTAQQMIFDANSLNPRGLIAFLFRAASDFPAHDTLKKILTLELNPELKIQIIHFLILGLNKPGPCRNRPKVAEYLNQARDIALSYPSTLAIQNYAAAVTNSSHGFGSIEDIELTKSHLETLWKGLGQSNDPQIYRSYVGAVQNLIAGDRLAPLSFEKKLEYVRQISGLAKNSGFTQDSMRALANILSTQFSNAIREDDFSQDSPSRTWILELQSVLVNGNSDDEHVRAVFTNSLTTAASQKHQQKDYAAHSRLIETLIDMVEFVREQELGQLAATLTAYCSNDPLGENSNPESRRLLKLMANVSTSAESLLKHIPARPSHLKAGR